MGMTDRLGAVLRNIDKVSADGAAGGLHPVQLRKSRHILVGKAEGTDQAEIVQVQFINIGICRLENGWFGNTQSGKKAHAQGNDGEDGEIAPERTTDTAQHRFPQHRLHHSISSTGVTFAFFSCRSTVPFFTEITRSAIAVNALLWVMMTTVMPVSRLVSCNSFKTCLPVT